MARERTLTALRRRAPESRPLLPAMSHDVRQQMRAEGQRGEELTRDMVYIPIREIAYTPEHLNSRVQYDRDSLADLAESIREHGIIQPIVVRPLPAAEATEWTLTIGDEPWTPSYILVAGNRRLMAAGEAGLDRIPAVIKVVDNERAFVLNIVENIHREGLTPTERARAISMLAALRDEVGRPMSSRRIATLVKKNHSTIVRWIGIHRQPLLLQAVEEGRVKIGHAMRLTRVPEGELSQLLDEAEDLSQPELEQRVAQIRKDPVLHSRRMASVDERRVMAALRSLSLIGAVDDAGPVRAGLQLVRSRVDELLGVTSRSRATSKHRGGA
jgi:ParB family transcriptional regulator, chromosome partitioning protein